MLKTEFFAYINFAPWDLLLSVIIIYLFTYLSMSGPISKTRVICGNLIRMI